MRIYESNLEGKEREILGNVQKHLKSGRRTNVDEVSEVYDIKRDRAILVLAEATISYIEIQRAKAA